VRLPVSSALLGLAMMSTQAFAQPATLDPVGTWLTEDGRAKIRLEKCGANNAGLCGFVAWMKDPLTEEGKPRTDIKNPDPAKRNRPSLGMQIMTNLKAEDETQYAGEIYNADDGKKYSVTIGMESVAELEVRGCLLHFLCASQTWARVPDGAPATKMVSTKAGKPAGLAGQHPHDSQETAH